MQKLKAMVAALFAAIKAWFGRLWFRITLSWTVNDRLEALEAECARLRKEIAATDEWVDHMEDSLCGYSGTLEKNLRPK